MKRIIMACLLLAPMFVNAANSQPNVIFILADDLGYSDVSCYGATGVVTPHIDQLAAEGLRFTDFHTAASICSPSRAAFLTGAYPQRCGLYMGINPNRTEHWFLGLNPDEITLAEQFKSCGYRTSMVGKWHLGTEPEFSPLGQGFDDYYGMPCNFAHSPRFFDGEQEVFAKTPLERLTELYTTRLTKLIRLADGPFFIYYAHNYPHTPYKAGVKFAGSSEDGVRGDVLQEFDWSVGEIMKALDETGVGDNTIVIFTSDNGPTKNEYALPYRGTKYVTYEGGHRVPFIVRWPKGIEKPATLDTNINAMDLFPTLSEIIDAPTPNDRVYDGVSLTPLFNGKTLARPDDQPFYYYNCENLQAVRRGDWKLHLPRTAEQIPFWDKTRKAALGGFRQPVLYNLREDLGESQDVADKHPEVVSRLTTVAEKARVELGEYMSRGSGQRPTGSVVPGVAIISNGKDWGQASAADVARLEKERKARHPEWNPRAKKAK